MTLHITKVKFEAPKSLLYRDFLLCCITFWDGYHADAEQKNFDEKHPCSLKNGALLIWKLSCGVEGHFITDVYKKIWEQFSDWYRCLCDILLHVETLGKSWNWSTPYNSRMIYLLIFQNFPKYARNTAKSHLERGKIGTGFDTHRKHNFFF